MSLFFSVLMEYHCRWVFSL